MPVRRLELFRPLFDAIFQAAQCFRSLRPRREAFFVLLFVDGAHDEYVLLLDPSVCGLARVNVALT